METLGERLASERRKLGRTVIDVETATNIRAGLIEALEAGEYERLPQQAYVRGYIQSYAKYLEIPVEPLLKMYEDETGSSHAPSRVRDLPSSQVVPRREHAHGLQMSTAVIIAAGIAAVALALWGIGRAFTDTPSETPPVPSTAGEATTTPDAEITPPPTSEETTTAEESVEEQETETTEAKPFTLTIEVATGGASWMVVTVDGEQEHVGTLEGGEKLTYEVVEEARVSQIGKPSSVRIERDGEPVEIPPSADVPSVTVTAE